MRTGRDRSSLLRLLAICAALLWLSEPVVAQMNDGGLNRSSSSSSRSSRSSSSRSSGSELGSSRSSSSRTSRTSARDDEDFDDGDDDSRSSRSRSSSSRGGSSRSGSGGGTRSFSTGGGGKGGGGSAPVAPPIVFGTKFEREGVHPRGALLSVAQFQALDCTRQPVEVGASVYYRCGDNWYQRIDHEGWTCYSEIWPPAGARVSSLPAGTFALTGGGRTFHAADHAWYERDPSGGYVIVEPPVGLTLDRLPESAKDGIPVVVNGVTYYRHLGVFYREEPGAPSGSRYAVAKSPFDPAQVAAAQPGTQTQSAAIEQGVSPTAPFVPSQPAAPMPSTPPAYLAPSVETTSPTPYHGSALPPPTTR